MRWLFVNPAARVFFFLSLQSKEVDGRAIAGRASSMLFCRPTAAFSDRVMRTPNVTQYLSHIVTLW